MDRLWAMTVFERIAESGSFSRAAESLDLANATVTTCIRNLERHLGVTLIHRDTRRLSLTEEGEIFLERAKAILGAVEDAESAVQVRGGSLRGLLVIEAPISFGHAVLCPAIPKFNARFPGITTAVNLTNQRHHLVEKAIDLAIRMDRVEDADLVARPIYEARHVLCCNPELAARLPGDPRELEPGLCLGVLREDRRAPVTWVLDRGSEHLEFEPRGALQINSSDALVQVARAGAGVIHVLDIFVNRALELGELVALYPDWDTLTRTFYVVTTKARACSAKTQAFIDFLTEVVDAERRPPPNRAVQVRSIGRR